MLANPNYCDDNTMMVIQMLAEGLYQRLLLSIDENILFDLFDILLRNINILPKFNLIILTQSNGCRCIGTHSECI